MRCPRPCARGLALALALALTSPALATDEGPRWIQVPAPTGEILRAAVVWPAGNGPAPVVLVLHGTEGFHEAHVHLAEAFARSGFIAVAGCWFAGEDCPRGPAFEGVTPQATRYVRALLAAARGVPRARTDHVGLFGHSRGGMLALLAASSGAEVQAVVASAAQLAPGLTATRRPRPIDVAPVSVAARLTAPVLLLHSVDDPTTDVREVLAYERALRELGKPVEAYYYDASLHELAFAAPTRDDVLRRSVEFLVRYLGR
jgi:dienelactone hydrolase